MIRAKCYTQLSVDVPEYKLNNRLHNKIIFNNLIYYYFDLIDSHYIYKKHKNVIVFEKEVFAKYFIVEE